MKRHLEKSNAPSNPTCWHREPSCGCLRVEMADGALHIFPYNQLVTASLTRSERHETLLIRLANHEVEIAGHNLRDLFLAFQDFAVKWVRATPTRYRELVDTEAGTVSCISITGIE